MKRVLHISARALKAIFTLLLLLFLGLTIFLNSNLFDSIIRKQIETRLGKAIKRDIRVEDVAFNPFRLDVHLDNFRIGNDPRSPEVPFFSAQDIYAKVSWKHLLGGRIRVSEVRLIRPELRIIFYKEGGNNWPKIERPKTTGPKRRGIDVVVEEVDCENMTVIMDQRRIPISFSVKDLQAFVEYDFQQHNYQASTSFKDGYLKIKDFEFFKFDLVSNYRIIGGRVAFERLFFLSDRSKFYMAGDMYNISKPFFDMRFRSHIDLTQTKQMFHFGPQMSGGGTFRAEYKGTFEKFRMKGSGNFRNFMFYSMPIESAKFDLDMTDNWLRVANIDARMFEGSYDGTFTIAPLKGHSVFRATAEWDDWEGNALTRFIRMRDMVLPVKASGTAAIQWEENGLRDMNGQIEFQTEPYAGMPLDLAAVAEATDFDNTLYNNKYVLPVTLDTRFRIAGRKLQDIQAHMETPYTSADIEGSVDFSGKANLDVRSQSAMIAEVDLLFHYLQAYFRSEPARAKEFWGVKGSADFTGKLDETVWSPFRPRITGQVDARNVLYHGVPWDTVRADVMLYHKLIDVRDSVLSYQKATARAQAKFFLEDRQRGTPDSLQTTVTVQNYPVVEIPHAFGLNLPVSGSVDADLTLEGPFDDLTGQAEFKAVRGEMWGEKWDRATGIVLFRPDSLGLRDVTAYTNGGSATVNGNLVYETKEYDVQFSARRVPLESLQILRDKGIEISGIASAEGSGSGTFRNPSLSGEISATNLKYRKELYGDVQSNVSLTADSLTLKAAGVARGIPSTLNAEMQLDGNLPFQAEFDITKFPVELLVKTYAPDTTGVTGLLGGRFEMSGTMRPVDIQNMSGSLDLMEINFAGMELKQARPLDVQLNNDVIQIRDSLLVEENARISLTGNIYPGKNTRLELDLAADLDLALLSEWNKDITAKGSSTIKVSIGGTLDQPTLAGLMEIQQGFFRHYSLPNSLTDITALVSFKNRNVTLQSFQANSSGGKLTAGGSGVLEGYSLGNYRFDVYAEKVRVHYPEGLRSTVNAELHLQTEDNDTYLSGDIEVLQGVYTRSFEAAPDVFGYASVPTFANLAGTGGEPQEVKLNIRITSEGNLLVRNNFADIQTSVNTTVVGTMEDPVVLGRLEVIKGEITFRDREYRVVRGGVNFSNPYRTEALLNFVAETRIREYQITLTFTGTFDQINHEITSDPPLPRDDLYAVLGIGQTPEEITGASVPALLAGEEISRFITNPIATPLERGFRQVFGLQRFTIDPTFVQSTQVPTARISLQKDISSDFSITYSTNLFTVAEEIVVLQYQLTDDIQITASKDERARYGIDILVTKSFE